MCGCDPIDAVAAAWEDKIEGVETPAPMQVTVPAWLVDVGDDPWAHVVVCTGCAEVMRID